MTLDGTSDAANQDFAPGLGNIPPAAHEEHGPPVRRRWPWIVGIVLLALIGLIAAGPSLLSSAWLNGRIRSYLNENLQDGTAVDFGKLDIAWSTGIRLTDFELRRSVSDEFPLLSAPLVEFDADVWPLFVRRLDVRKFVFHDPVVRIERTREGALNTEDVVKTRKKKRNGAGEDEATVLPAIDVPVEVHGLRLVIVGDDGREVERGGIEFTGHLTTRNGPTKFDLHVPVGAGAMDVDGSVTLFDAEGLLLPVDSIAVQTIVKLNALDAAQNRDLLTLFTPNAPTAGVLDGQITLKTVGRAGSGQIEMVVRNLSMREGAAAGERENLRLTGAFETDGKRLTIRDGLILADGLEGHIQLSGTLAALDGKATFHADLARSAAALSAMGVRMPEGIGGLVDGSLTFTPSPSRAIGRMTIEGLRAPAAVDGSEPLAIEHVTADLVLVPGADAVMLESATIEIPGELKTSVNGEIGHDGSLALAITVAGRVPEIVRRAKAMGLAPQGLAIAGSVDGKFEVTRTADSGDVGVKIEQVALRDEGVRVDAAGTIAADGALDLRVSGDGALESLLAAGGADERLDALKGKFAFDATANGPSESIAAELRSLRIDGDLQVAASGRMRGDGRIEGTATLDGRIPDAIALARGLGLLEGDVPLAGRIHGGVRIAGSRQRPEVPSATLTIDEGPVQLELSGSISELGTLEATVTSTAQLDALLEIAHARGFLARPHSTGGQLLISAVVAGTREKPELPTLKLSVDGPLSIRADGSLDADGAAHVRSRISGALEPLAALLAAVQDDELQPVSGTYEGDISLDGPMDAPQIRVSQLLVRSQGVTMDANAAVRPGGATEAALALRGPLEGVFALAHSFGQLADVSGTGALDVAMDIKLSGSDDERMARGSLTGTVHDLAMLRADVPDFVWHEERLRFAVPSFKQPLGAPREGTAQRPIAFELDSASGVWLRAQASGGTEGRPVELRAELKGPLQPLIDASAVFTGGGAGLKVAGSIATAEPLTFMGDISSGRDGAAGWSGGSVIRLTDVVAPHVSIPRGTITAKIGGGALHLEPIDVAINGGTATGRATIGLVGEKPEHSMTLNAKEVRIDAELAPLLSRAMPILAVGDAGDAGGKAGIDVDLTAKGLDGDKLRNTVSGKGVMTLDGVFAESRNWIGQLLELVGGGARLEVPRANVPFTVTRGKITTENLDVIGTGMDLRLGGDVGLDGTIDYTFLVKPKQGGSLLDRYAKLVDAGGYLPLRLKGDISSPDLKLPSVTDSVKSGLGGLLEDALNKKAKDEEEKRKKEAEEEAQREQRRKERRERKQAEEEAAKAGDSPGGDPPPPPPPVPDDSADNPTK